MNNIEEWITNFKEKYNTPIHIYILGVPNSGKSTLFNKIVGSELSEVSAKPNTTTNIITENLFEMNITDTPAIGNNPKTDARLLNQCLDEASVVILLISTTSKITDAEIDIYNQLRGKLPIFVSLNKIDSVDDEERKNIISEVKEKLNIENLSLISAKNGKIDSLLIDILENYKNPLEELEKRFSPSQNELIYEKEFKSVSEKFFLNYKVNPQIFFTGLQGCGKTTLLSKIIGEELDKLSNLEINLIEKWGISWTDTPSLIPSAQSNLIILNKGQKASLFVHVINGAVGITNTDKMVINLLKESKPFIVVLNKIDTLEKAELSSIIEGFNYEFKWAKENFIPISAKEGLNIDILVKKIEEILSNENLEIKDIPIDYPSNFLASKEEKKYKNVDNKILIEKAKKIIKRNALAASLASLIPMPIANISSVTAIQAEMVVELALIFGKSISLERAKEIIGAIAGGIAIRGIANKAKRFIKIPIASKLVDSTITYTGTYALGEAALIYFKGDINLKMEDFKKKWR